MVSQRTPKVGENTYVITILLMLNIDHGMYRALLYKIW